MNYATYYLLELLLLLYISLDCQWMRIQNLIPKEMERANPSASQGLDIHSTPRNERSNYTLFMTEKLTFDLAPAYPLRIFANRYTPHKPRKDGFTLLLIHATGMHKETWEPTLARLLDPAQPGGHSIYEVYSLEIPNHGESAVQNTETIQRVYGEDCSLKDCANAFNMLLTAHPSTRFAVDFSNRKLVGIGHSMGAVIFCLMHIVSTPPPILQSLIMIEPGMVPHDLSDSCAGLRTLSSWTWTRNDTWSSRKSARIALSQDASYSGTWDTRILDLYIQHALTVHSALKHEGAFKFTGVTTAISRAQEVACYRNDDLVIESIKAYTALFSQPTHIRVHIICGTERSIITPNVQHVLCDTSIGHYPVSVRHIPGAGHLAVQQRPDDVGRILACVLGEDIQQLQNDKMEQIRSRL